MSEYQTVKLFSKEVNDEASFPCPKCKNLISPEDSSEENYKILGAKLTGKKESMLRELMIQCIKCGTKIKLLAKK